MPLKTCNPHIVAMSKSKSWFCLFSFHRCSECKKALSESYFAKDKILYCQDHYMAKFAKHCHKCDTVITGPVMVCVQPSSNNSKKIIFYKCWNTYCYYARTKTNLEKSLKIQVAVYLKDFLTLQFVCISLLFCGKLENLVVWNYLLRFVRVISVKIPRYCECYTHDMSN